MILYLALGAAALAVLTQKEKIVDKIDNMTDAWTRWDAFFQAAGSKYDVDWTWLKAICLNESDLGRAKSVALGLQNPSDIEGSKSSDGKSWGLMQVTLTTAKGLDPLATQQRLNDPGYSIDLAARYIKELKGMFSPADSNRLEWIVKSYNQGPGNTRKEIRGTGGGFADVYWERFQRNLERVEDSL